MGRDRTVDVGEVQLHLREWDRADGATPVVLLPATGETCEDWELVAEALAATRPVHAVDLRGHGASDWCGTYSIGAMAEDVVGLLQRVADDAPVDLVGHSLGGLVACRAAASIPHLVRRLVLEDVGLLHPRPSAMPDRPPGDLPFDWRVVEQVRPEIDQPTGDWPEVLRAITAPTLVIAGGRTSPVSAEHTSELIDLVPDSRSVTVEAGHHVHADAPEAFLEHLLSFLDH